MFSIDTIYINHANVIVGPTSSTTQLSNLMMIMGKLLNSNIVYIYIYSFKLAQLYIYTYIHTHVT